MSGLSEADVSCDCGHDVIWHHERRGCGYHGYADRRCDCLLASAPAVEAIVARAVNKALTEAANEIESVDEGVWAMAGMNAATIAARIVRARTT